MTPQGPGPMIAPSSMRDLIRIEGLTVDCVVGVHPHERDTLQPLRVDIELRLDTERAAATERLSRSVDYGVITAQVVFLLQSARFRLLETAAHVLARHLLAPPAPGQQRAAIESVRLRLEKPGALEGRGVPSLEIERPASWVVLGHEDKPFGTVDIIHETRDAGIYRLNVVPGRGIPLHVHRSMRESEMILGDGLLCQGRPAAPGTVHRWPLGAAHGYDNPTDRTQTILCVDVPRFDEGDEIPVDGPPADVDPEPGYLRFATGGG